jgi:hypothetical protein
MMPAPVMTTRGGLAWRENGNSTILFFRNVSRMPGASQRDGSFGLSMVRRQLRLTP